MRAHRVLIVEDNLDTALLVEHAIRTQEVHARLETVHDGWAALERLRSDPELPDLVLLDLKLPGLTGLGVLQALRADLRTRALPVVVFTSSTEESDLQASYLAGANSYLRKPVDYDQMTSLLAETVHYWLLLNNGPPKAA